MTHYLEPEARRLIASPRMAMENPGRTADLIRALRREGLHELAAELQQAARGPATFPGGSAASTELQHHRD